jgi:GAF domain-containing protein
MSLRDAPVTKAGSVAEPSLGDLKRELAEAREREAATAEVLKVISSSPGDLIPVFTAMLENAMRICHAKFGALFRFEDGEMRIAARLGVPVPMVEALKTGDVHAGPHNPMTKLVTTGELVHVEDYRLHEAYREGDPMSVVGVELGGIRTLLLVPMIKDTEIVGAISIFRQHAEAFSPKQIELLSGFAAQAVIAIENTRLLNELRQRTDDLAESLEQQTATSEVLKVISSSSGELEPVFQAMLANATRLCGAKFGNLYLCEGDAFRISVMHNVPAAFAEERRRQPIFHAPPGSALRRAAESKRAVHIPDVRLDRGYIERQPLFVTAVELGGFLAMLSVPMLKDGDLIGAINVYRQEVGPFSEKQIELVQNFAAQAVIAIENARLLNELRESLDQQTATSEVLRVVSNSPDDLQPVFEAMLDNAVRICGANYGTLYLSDGNKYKMAALHNAPPEFAEFQKRRGWFYPTPGAMLEQAMLTKKVCHSADASAEAVVGNSAKIGGARSTVYVPMLKEGNLVGAIVIYRQEVRPFTEKQVALVENFASQAVIAIENARVLSELHESLEQQTATSQVLQVISTSPGDLRPVFEAMLENATRICDAKFANLFLYSDNSFRIAAQQNAPAAYAERWQKEPTLSVDDSPHNPLTRLLATKGVVHVDDLSTDQGYIGHSPRMVTLVESAKARTLVAVPMLKDDNLVGAIVIYRQEVRPFTEKQIQLVQNFASQAVIAIENARLLNELNKLNQQLEQRVSDQLGEIERMSRLRRFLPPQVADLIVAQGNEKELDSHRREITALFCDLRGFTGFSESADPEDVMALLREYHAAIGDIIHRHSGTLERYAGDGVMVIFNDPVKVDNPALKAVHVALEMRAALSVLIEKWRRLGHDLGFGIGISHGYATLGTIGFEGRFDYAAIGTVSNVASRLCDEAKPGQILISPRVLLAVENAVTVEKAGEFELKGIRRPMEVHNVVGLAAAKA